MSAILYREKQRFQLGGKGIALAIPPVAILALCLRQMVWHHPWGNPPMTNGGMVFLTVLVLLVYLRLMLVHLRTELWPDRLSVAMKGLFRKVRIPVTEIAGAEAVEYEPVSEYGGYGVRDGPRGKAYIASGTRGVHVTLNDGREFLIGSQRADELAQGINQARNARAR